MPDIGAIEHASDFPLDIVFWRPADETLTRHRNPMFSRELGVTPSRSVVVDLLHAVYLGILLVWSRVTIWALISAGAYGDANTREGIFAAVLVLRSRLMRFYPVYERAHQETLTRVADFTPTMIGSADNPQLKTKGAETWGVALFLIAELKEKYSMIPNSEGARLMHAGQSLEQVIRIWKGAGWVMPARLQEEAFERMVIFVDLMRVFEAYVPKFHLVFHALSETGTKGNPWFYSSWLDEALNKQLKGCCRNASAQTFDETVLLKMCEVLKEEVSCVKARKRHRD